MIVRWNQLEVINRVNPEQRQLYEEKFLWWDRSVREGWLEDSDKRGAVYEMLNDPTIYAYSSFKNKDGTPFKLYDYQDLILNDKRKRVLFAAANQIGKSIALCWKATSYALMHPGKTVLMVSKTLPQAKDLLLQIRSFLRTSTLDYKAIIGMSENRTEIYFKHFDVEGNELAQSRIICVPATEAALGYAVDLLLIDELAFYDDGDYFYYQIAQPRTYTTKGQIIVFSNPNGQQGVFWKLWNDKNFAHYNFNFLDKPGNSQQEYDILKTQLTAEQFDSTVCAIFTNPAGGFLTVEERARIQVKRGNILPMVYTKPVYIFYDWAKAVDRTVRTIGVPLEGRETDWADKVYVHEMKEYPQGTPYDEIIMELKDYILDIGPANVAMVGFDVSGVGKGLEDFVKRVQDLGIMVMPVEFSLQNKSRIYTLFKLLVENDRITIPFVEECDKQLASLRFKRSGRGYLQVHHQSEVDRDDFPDSLAGLCSLMISPDNPPITCEII